MLSQSESSMPLSGQLPVAPTDWAMILAPRVGAPPLRFKGRQIFHRTTDTLFVTLWERKKGAFVLGYSDFQDHAVQPHALVVTDLKDAAVQLEACCPDDWTAPPSLSSMAPTFEGLQRALHYRHHFPYLVGDTLAIWDDQIHLPPPNSSR